MIEMYSMPCKTKHPYDITYNTISGATIDTTGIIEQREPFKDELLASIERDLNRKKRNPKKKKTNFFNAGTYNQNSQTFKTYSQIQREKENKYFTACQFPVYISRYKKFYDKYFHKGVSITVAITFLNTLKKGKRQYDFLEMFDLEKYLLKTYQDFTGKDKEVKNLPYFISHMCYLYPLNKILDSLNNDIEIKRVK